MHIWDAVFNSYGTILYCITGSSIVLPAGNEAQKSSHLFVLSTHSIPSFLCLSSKTFHRSLNVTCDLQSKIFRLISPSLRFHLQVFVRFDFLFFFCFILLSVPLFLCFCCVFCLADRVFLLFYDGVYRGLNCPSVSSSFVSSYASILHIRYFISSWILRIRWSNSTRFCSIPCLFPWFQVQ